MSGGMIIIDTSGLADTVMTTNGDIVYYNGGRSRLPKGADGEVLELSGGFPSWESAEGLSLGSKGDIHTRSATAQTALSLGSNGQVLEADSTTTTGLKWATASGGGASLATDRSDITSGFTTTSTTFVDSGLQITVSNNAGGKGNIMSSVGLYNSDANRWSIMSVYNSTDSSTIQQQGAMGNGYNVTAGAVVDLDGDTYVLRLRNDSSGYTAGFHANVWMTASFWSFEVY